MKNTRRDLLKASVATPVITTICAGSAFAASIDCANKDALRVPQPPVDSATADIWQRKTVSLFLRVPPTLLPGTNLRYFPGDDGFWYSLDVGATPHTITKTSVSTSVTGSGPAGTTNVLRYVNINSPHTIYKGYDPGVGRQPITGTCWSSVAVV